LIKIIDYAWRLFGTGLSFSVFGLGGLFLGIVLFPTLLVVIRDERRRQIVARGIIGKSFSAFVWMMKSLGVLSYEITGSTQSKFPGNCLIVANHPTLIDVVFLVSLFPQADCVVKSALWRNPFTRGAVSAANYISNDDGPEVIEQCVRKLRDGAALILFPEGTRTVPNVEIDFRMGAAAIAVRANSTVLPVVITCHPTTLYKNDAWYNIPVRKPAFRFEILPVERVENLVPGGAGLRVKRRILNQSLMLMFKKHLSPE
jgi:1-acyl-sn-glycerol-3-phosphate acyltransferase